MIGSSRFGSEYARVVGLYVGVSGGKPQDGSFLVGTDDVDAAAK